MLFDFGEVKHLSTRGVKINREFVSSGERKRRKSFLLDLIYKNTQLEIDGALEGDCPVL